VRAVDEVVRRFLDVTPDDLSRVAASLVSAPRMLAVVGLFDESDS
jgi:hypothetical protein